jgi:hypothetical protein
MKKLEELYPELLMIGWQFQEIGYEQIVKPAEFTLDGMRILSATKCAQYCELCRTFIGRWISDNKYWCKECADKFNCTQYG